MNDRSHEFYRRIPGWLRRVGPGRHGQEPLSMNDPRDLPTSGPEFVRPPFLRITLSRQLHQVVRVSGERR